MPALIVREEPTGKYFVTEIQQDKFPHTTLELLKAEINQYSDLVDLQRYSHLYLLKSAHVFNRRILPADLGLRVEILSPPLFEAFLQSEVIKDTFDNMYIYKVENGEWNAYDVKTQQPLF